MARDRTLSTKRAAGFERTRQLNAYTSAGMRVIFIYALLCFAERSLKAAIESDIYQPRIVEKESKSATFDAKPHHIVSWPLFDGRFE